MSFSRAWSAPFFAPTAAEGVRLPVGVGHGLEVADAGLELRGHLLDHVDRVTIEEGLATRLALL